MPNIYQGQSANIKVLSDEEKKEIRMKACRRQIDMMLDGKGPMFQPIEDDENDSIQNKDMRYGIPSPEKNPNAWYYYFIEPTHNEKE